LFPVLRGPLNGRNDTPQWAHVEALSFRFFVILKQNSSFQQRKLFMVK